MAEDKIYLTVGKNPKGGGLLAIISQGQPQEGAATCTVLDLEIVPNMKAAKRWYKQAMIERPWEPRN